MKKMYLYLFGFLVLLTLKISINCAEIADSDHNNKDHRLTNLIEVYCNLKYGRMTEDECVIARKNILGDIKRLLDEKADPNGQIVTKYNQTFIALAKPCTQGITEIVQMLLDAKADANLQFGYSYQKITPLICSVLNARVEITKLLIDAGANIMVEDPQYLNPKNIFNLIKMNPYQTAVDKMAILDQSLDPSKQLIANTIYQGFQSFNSMFSRPLAHLIGTFIFGEKRA